MAITINFQKVSKTSKVNHATKKRVRNYVDPSKVWACGFGDGVHDFDLYGYGATKAEAALDFVNKLNKSDIFFIDINRG